jgi:hypothetical protein
MPLHLPRARLNPVDRGGADRRSVASSQKRL